MDTKTAFRLVAAALMTVLILSAASCAAPPSRRAETPAAGEGPSETGADSAFSFYIRWGVYGISSYDSSTGRLVKTSDATDPSRYVRELRLGDEDLAKIRKWLLEDVGIFGYPDEYDPFKGAMSEPSQTVVIRVTDGERSKTVTCSDISLSSWEACRSPEGERFMRSVADITDLIRNTDEWKALPDYEFFYD